MNKDNIQKLLKPRYKVIADYPANHLGVGFIVPDDFHNPWELSDDIIAFYNKYPHLFRRLEWWQERTLDELMSVRFVRITTYTGYWAVGDVVKVTDYKIDTKKKVFERYVLDVTQSSIPMRCEPATETEYLNQTNQP